MTLARHLGAAIVLAAIVVLLSIQLSAYRDFQLAEVAAYLVAVAGLTVLIGLSGQISIGHGAFMAIGGYTTALLLTHLGWPLALILLASVVIAAAGGALFGTAAARLRGPYLAGGRGDTGAAAAPAGAPCPPWPTSTRSSSAATRACR